MADLDYDKIPVTVSTKSYAGREPSGRRWSSECSWVVRGSIPGKLLVAEALRLGVPKGPMLGLLKSGREGTLPGGEVIKPSDCVGPTTSWCVRCYDFTHGFPEELADAENEEVREPTPPHRTSTYGCLC